MDRWADPAVTRPPHSCLAFSASATNRSDPGQNQDAHRVLTAEEDGVNAVIVCDGLGSLERSGEAARMAASITAGMLSEHGADAARLAFETAHWQIRDRFLGDGGTTMIVLSECSQGLRAHYVGNGAILQLCELLETAAPGAPSPVRLAWTNHLLPHTAYEHGREVMEAVLGIGPATPPEPDSVVISARRAAQLVVAVTDGILSREQVRVGSTADGERWERLDPALIEVLELSEAVLRRLREAPASAEELGKLLETRLAGLTAAGSLDDDATVGALVCLPSPGSPRDAVRPA
jgi:hypothetical protein